MHNMGNTLDQNLKYTSPITKLTKENITPPLKQLKSGISIDEIQCRDDLQLVIKTKNGSPSFVKPYSIARLITSGWYISDDELTMTLSKGQRVGFLLVGEIFSDHITGLNFMDYPIAREDGIPITLHIGESASNGCTIELIFIKTSDNTTTFLKKYNDRQCPICLSEDTVIDTPNGPVNIKNLKNGMVFYSYDPSDNKNIETILKTGNTMVIPGHKMIHIV